MDQAVARGIELIRQSENILAFTGAGLSTESGIPDFRSPGGIWDRYDPSDFYFQKIVSDEKAREKYWEMSSEFYGMMKDAVPNRAHLAIAVDPWAPGEPLALQAPGCQNLPPHPRTLGRAIGPSQLPVGDP